MNDDFPILAGVAAGATYPYQLLEYLNSRGLHATRSTLYRRVDGLVAEGSLFARELRGDRGHLRRTLELTTVGLQRLAEEIPHVLRDEPLESPFFGLALDCVEGAKVMTDLSAVFLARLRQAERHLLDDERALTAAGDSNNAWAQAGRVRRIAHTRADIDWMRAALGIGEAATLRSASA